MEIKSSRRFIKTAPDKIRILSQMLKGKNYPQAIAQLQFSAKAAAKPLILVLKQAKDQVKERALDEEQLIIREIRVDEGPKLKRRLIRHQGRSTPILKRMSHLTIILTDENKSEVQNQKLKENKNE